VKKDPSLSLYAVPGGSIKGRVVAILLNDKTAPATCWHHAGAENPGRACQTALFPNGEVTPMMVLCCRSPRPLPGAPSLTVDAVIVPGGDLASLLTNGDAVYYLLEAYKHLKPIALAGDARQFKRS
jgi:catalase